MKKHIIIALIVSVFVITHLSAEDDITMSDILQRIQNNNLELKSMQHQIEASKSEITQARLFSNPELEIDLGNFGKEEIGIGIGQSFELGGKRNNRIKIAEIELKKIELDFEMKKLELEISAIQGVLPILSLESKLTLLDSVIVIEESTLETIRKRIESGSTMPIDAIRAEMDLEELILERNLVQKEIVQLKKNLSTLWSSTTVDFNKVSGILNPNLSIPSIDIFKNSLLDHPEIKIIELDRRLSKLELKDIKKSSIPDLNIGVGVTRDIEAEENSIGLSASIELPFFNRNQGEIKGKVQLNSAFEFDTSNELLIKQAELQELYNNLITVNEELNAIETKILPKAETIFQALLGYYKNGSVSFLDVIEAQTELLEYKTSVIESHVARAELLTGLYELTGYKTRFIIND